jgi:hypothetical protein
MDRGVAVFSHNTLNQDQIFEVVAVQGMNPISIF